VTFTLKNVINLNKGHPTLTQKLAIDDCSPAWIKYHMMVDFYEKCKKTICCSNYEE